MGLVAAIAASCLGCGIVIGSAGTRLVQKLKKESSTTQDTSDNDSEE